MVCKTKEKSYLVIMLDRFLDYLNSIYKPKPNQVFLLAVSSGVDSVVLSHLFAAAHIPFAIAHCNFQLRGEESNGDMAFVKSLAETYQVPFHCKVFDTKTEQQGSGESTQMIARKLRYHWFNELLEEYQYIKLVTAHHLNDNVETVLLNTIRGTGVKGLSGIAPVSEQLVRPLLFATKIEIENFAKTEGLTWREDSSNQSDKYKRNLIRHHAIDLFEQLNPNFLHTFSDNIERWKLLAEHVAVEVKKIDTNFKTPTGWTIEEAFLKTISNHAILLEWLKEKGFAENQFQELLKAKLSGKQWEAEKYVAVYDRGRLLVSEKANIVDFEIIIEEGQSEVIFPGGKLTFATIAKPQNLAQPNIIAQLDASKLTFPLTLRNWQLGDKFQPFGMKGKKKVSDFLIDQKVPIHEKNKVLVLLSENKICWVVGLRVDERFKVEKESEVVFMVERQ